MKLNLWMIHFTVQCSAARCRQCSAPQTVQRTADSAVHRRQCSALQKVQRTADSVVHDFVHPCSPL